MAKATIVSLFPQQISERKPGVFPGLFEISPAPKDGFSFLVVSDSFYWINFAEDERDPLKMPIPAMDIAKSVVNDFVRNIPGYNFANKAMPGLFIIDKEVGEKTIATEYKKELDEAREKQNRWYNALVLTADDLWEKSHQHRLINSLQRHACRALNLERPWMVEVAATKIKVCEACMKPVHPEAIICSSCGFVVNPTKFEKVKGMFVVRKE